MADDNRSAEDLAMQAFWITLAGTAAYVLAVFLFVL
jgi:hypothetical protein